MNIGHLITSSLLIILCQQVGFNTCELVSIDGVSSDFRRHDNHNSDHGSHGSNLSFTLEQLYGSDYFTKLSTSFKILLIELLASAEVDQITNLINKIGFSQILALIDDLTAMNVTIAHSLEIYIAKELKEESHTSSQSKSLSSSSSSQSHSSSSSSSSSASSSSASSSSSAASSSSSSSSVSSSSSSSSSSSAASSSSFRNLLKRELQSFLFAMKTSSSYQKLSQTNKDLLVALIKAAESGSVNRFVQRVGYFTVIELIEKFHSAQDTHTFITYLIEHLNSESHQTTPSDLPEQMVG